MRWVFDVLNRTAMLVLVSAIFVCGATAQDLKTAIRGSGQQSNGNEIKPFKKGFGSNLIVGGYKEIPKASEPCTPQECDWWERFRSTGNAFLKKRNEVTFREFMKSFAVGLGQGYRIPVTDRRPQLLLPVFAGRSKSRPKNGIVEVELEVLVDGSVGEVILTKSLRPDMDTLCVNARRGDFYLPAIRDGSFVKERIKSGCGFWAKDGEN